MTSRVRSCSSAPKGWMPAKLVLGMDSTANEYVSSTGSL